MAKPSKVSGYILYLWLERLRLWFANFPNHSFHFLLYFMIEARSGFSHVASALVLVVPEVVESLPLIPFNWGTTGRPRGSGHVQFKGCVSVELSIENFFSLR